MWTIIKYKKNYLKILMTELKKRTQKDISFYNPKVSITKHLKNKIINKEETILGDYIFCYYKDFNIDKTFDNFKYIKGLKYFLKGHRESQAEINSFINLCKSYEDKDGNLNLNFCNLIIKKDYKFLSGPFAEKIFKILSIKKERILIRIGNLETSIKNNKYLFSPV